MKQLLCIALAVIAAPAFASEPGEPLDCSDWVFLEPGLSCADYFPYPCYGCTWGDGLAFDNEGYSYRMRTVEHAPGPTTCGGALYRIEIVRYNGSTETVIAQLAERCVSGQRDGVQSSGHLLFDSNGGRLLPAVLLGGQGYDTGHWIPAISGLAPLFDVLQSFQPTTAVGFVVPFRPEGFQAASFFDTYYGDLATVGDWSQVQPLQCAYPATAPSSGDYLTIDAVPTPAIYVITATNYLGQRRYGRRNVGGTLTGRDPAVLPVCQ